MLMLVIGLLPMIYLWNSWSAMPDVVPTHFDLNGKPNDYSSKQTLALVLLVLGLLPVGLKFVLGLDPAKQSILNANNLQKIRLGLSVFLAFVGVTMTQSGIEGNLSSILGTLLAPAMLVLMAFLGNYLTNLRPNYMAGVRTPWTLASTNVWQKTHLLAGRLMFGLCLAAVIPCIFLPMPYNLSLAACVILIAAFYPVYYSYRIRETAEETL